MKKYYVSFVFIVAFAFYALISQWNSTEVAAPAPASSATGQSTPTQTNPQTPVSQSSPFPIQSPSPTKVSQLPPVPVPSQSVPQSVPVQNTGLYKNGTYTGTVADAYYGNVQVQATVSGDKLTDVRFLQYPSDRRTSVMINTQAMPILKTEAIMAQSANVDGVSGATATSGAFIQSLTDALAQASQ